MRPIAGFALIAVAAFMLLGFFNADLSGTWSAVAALVVAVGIPGVAGAALLRSHFGGPSGLRQRREDLRLQTVEAELLRLAGEHDGRLTVVEVVRELSLGHEETETILRSLVERGIADVEVTDTGLLVYVFDDVRRLADKASSKGVLDA